LVFVGINGIQSHPPTYTLIAGRLLMRFMTQAMIYTMVLTKITVGVVLDWGAMLLLLAYFTTSASTVGHSLKALTLLYLAYVLNKWCHIPGRKYVPKRWYAPNNQSTIVYREW